MKGNLGTSTALYIYTGGEHCTLNWGDINESTLLLEARMTGGEQCTPGAGTIVRLGLGESP